MKLRKIAAALTALCLLLALAACGGGSGAPAEVKPSVVTPKAQNTPAPAPSETPAPEPSAEPDPEPSTGPTIGEGEHETFDGIWEPDWSLLDFTEAEGAARFVRERYASKWSNDYGSEEVFFRETLTAYDDDGHVLFERTVDSDGYAAEYVYTYNEAGDGYDYETYIDNTCFRDNQGEEYLDAGVYEAVSDVLICTHHSGTYGESRTDFAYDTKGNLIEESVYNLENGGEYLYSVREYEYDPWDGWLIRETEKVADEPDTVTETQYEYEDGLLCAQLTTIRYLQEGTKRTWETHYEYDEAGDLTVQETVSSEGVERWEYEYDEVMGGVSRLRYNGFDNYEETYAYTEWGDILSWRTEYFDDEEVDTAEYEYDIECRLVKVTQEQDCGASRTVSVTTYTYEFA